MDRDLTRDTGRVASWQKLYPAEQQAALQHIATQDQPGLQGMFYAFLLHCYSLHALPLDDAALGGRLGYNYQRWGHARRKLIELGILAILSRDGRDYLTLGRLMPMQRAAMEVEFGLPFRDT